MVMKKSLRERYIISVKLISIKKTLIHACRWMRVLLTFFSYIYLLQEPALQAPAFALQINCVIVPIGQYTHQLLGLNKIIVIKPKIVEVSITL